MNANDPVPLPLSTKVALVGRVEVVKVGVVKSASLALIPRFRLAPSATVCGPIAAKTGAWLVFVTVIATISESVALPSPA